MHSSATHTRPAVSCGINVGSLDSPCEFTTGEGTAHRKAIAAAQRDQPHRADCAGPTAFLTPGGRWVEGYGPGDDVREQWEGRAAAEGAVGEVMRALGEKNELLGTCVTMTIDGKDGNLSDLELHSL